MMLLSVLQAVLLKCVDKEQAYTATVEELRRAYLLIVIVFEIKTRTLKELMNLKINYT